VNKSGEKAERTYKQQQQQGNHQQQGGGGGGGGSGSMLSAATSRAKKFLSPFHNLNPFDTSSANRTSSRDSNLRQSQEIEAALNGASSVGVVRRRRGMMKGVM
jgi:hypothetical protein